MTVARASQPDAVEVLDEDTEDRPTKIIESVKTPANEMLEAMNAKSLRVRAHMRQLRRKISSPALAAVRPPTPDKEQKT